MAESGAKSPASHDRFIMMPASPGPQTSEAHASEISREELLARLDDSALQIVDVLPQVAYDEAHIVRALSLPFAEIDARARMVLPDLTADVAVYCGGPT